MMSKFFYTLIISFLFIVKGIADEHVILLQCKNNGSENFLQEIYEINLETKKAKGGSINFNILEANETEILITTLNSIFEKTVRFNRLDGTYFYTFKWLSNNEKKLITGTCFKRKKTF